MNRKGVFDITNYVIGVLLFMGVVVTFAAFTTSIGSKYSFNADNTSEFQNTYDQIKQVEVATDSASQKTQEASTGLQSQYTFLGNFIDVMKTLSAVSKVPSALWRDISTRFDIPAIWVSIGLTVVALMLISVFIYTIFRRY